MIGDEFTEAGTHEHLAKPGAQLFNTADSVNAQERKALGRVHSSRIKAVWTGEKRCPKEGEWFLSGATIHAYRTPTDLTDQEYPIAKLVAIERVNKYTITAELTNK